MSRALILIDFQEGFDAPFWGARNNPDAEARAAFLLKTWRDAKAPIVHIQHHSQDTNSPLHPEFGQAMIKAKVAPLPNEPVMTKEVNSAFIGTDLQSYLDGLGVRSLVICGLTTPHCVSTTTRMAANLGYEVQIAHDACAAFVLTANARWRGGDAVDAQAIHDAALDHLHGEFAEVLPASKVTP
ncbi:MAG: cysteine hydrolase family protein [Maritimibacter sp.]